MNRDDRILLAHGDGGGLASRFIKEEIVKRFNNPSLNKLEDGSLIELDDRKNVISTDSFIVDPPVFPGGDIGKLSITGTCNDLIASGAIPRYLTFSLIISEGFPFPKLRDILDSAKKTAELIGVEVVAGDTKVLPALNDEFIYINTTGLGSKIRENCSFSISNACDGDKIIITGTVGDHGFSVLSLREGLGFESRVVSDCNSLHEMLIPLVRKFHEIQCMRDPTRGGLNGVLFDIAETTCNDILIEEKKIPVRHEVRIGCEMLGINPFQLVNEGIMVLVVSPAQAEEVLKELRKNSLGINSSIIGTVKKNNSPYGRVIMKGDHKKKIILRQQEQTLPRLC